MPSRYLNLPEPSYIPKYQPMDTNVLMGTANNITNQIERGQQSIDVLDTTRQDLMSRVGNLTPEQQHQMSESFNQSRAELDSHVEKHGVRGARNLASRTARNFAQQANPYIQRSQQISTMQESLDNVTSRDMRTYLSGLISKTNQTTDVGQQLQMSDYLDVANHWIDYAEFAKQRKSLMSSRGQSNTITDTDGNVIPARVQTSDGIEGLLNQRGRSVEDVTRLLIDEALTDSQMRRQLELEAEAIATSDARHPIFGQMVDETGEFDASAQVYVKFLDEDNTEPDRTSKPLNASEVMALNKFGGMGELMADYSAQVRHNQLTNGNRDLIGFADRSFTYLDSGEKNDTASEWVMRNQQQMTNLNAEIQTNLNILNDQYGNLDVSLNADNLLEVNTSEGRIAMTDYIEKIRETNPNKANLLDITNREQLYARSQIIRIENTIGSYKDAIDNNLGASYSPFSSAIIMEDGKFKVDRETIKNIVVEKPESLNLENLRPVNEDFLRSYGLNPDTVGNGQLKKLSSQSTIDESRVGDYNQVPTETYVYRKDGKLYTLDTNSIRRGIESIISETNEQMEAQLNQSQQLSALQVDPKLDAALIDSFKGRHIDLTNSVTDNVGNVIEIDNFIPQSMGLINGVYTIGGVGEKAEGSNITAIQNLRFTGRQAEQIIRQKLGPAHASMMLTAQVENMIIPNFKTNEKSVTELQQADLVHTFGDNAFNGQNVSITTYKHKSQGETSPRFTVKIGETYSTPFRNTHDMTRYLATENQELLREAAEQRRNPTSQQNSNTNFDLSTIDGIVDQIGVAESQNNSLAVSDTGAGGTYQWTRDTWNSMIKSRREEIEKLGFTTREIDTGEEIAKNPDEFPQQFQRQMTIWLTEENARIIGTTEPHWLYSAHFIGPTVTKRIINALSHAKVIDLVPIRERTKIENSRTNSSIIGPNTTVEEYTRIMKSKMGVV